MLSGWTRESSYARVGTGARSRKPSATDGGAYARVGTGARFDLWQSCCSLIEDFAQVFYKS